MTDLKLPIIDISGLASTDLASRLVVARKIDEACRQQGFFYVIGHGIDPELIARMENLTREFFALDEETKLKWRMELGGRAWRGYFPLGGELTSNRPDWKEGLYLANELGPEDPDVIAGTPLQGANLFPDVPGFRETSMEYMHEVTQVGHRLMEGIALGLGLEPNYFYSRYTGDPLTLLRLFNYPSQPVPEGMDVQWGVGEHTDYGVLTLLRQADIGGLQVRTSQGWLEAPPVPGSFVCNLGDMLERMTGGLYRSTPHRVVRNTSGRDRLSIPLFFDPNFRARLRPIEGLPQVSDLDDSKSRWDNANIHVFDGQYGDYLINKVSKVFPQLRRDVL